MNIIKCTLQAGGIGIWKCWFLWREENRRTRRKTLGARTRTNNKLNPHMTPGPGIEPGPHWWRASTLTTAPSLLPAIPAAFTGKKFNSIKIGTSWHFLVLFFSFCNENFVISLFHSIKWPTNPPPPKKNCINLVTVIIYMYFISICIYYYSYI